MIPDFQVEMVRDNAEKAARQRLEENASNFAVPGLKLNYAWNLVLPEG